MWLDEHMPKKNQCISICSTMCKHVDDVNNFYWPWNNRIVDIQYLNSLERCKVVGISNSICLQETYLRFQRSSVRHHVPKLCTKQVNHLYILYRKMIYYSDYKSRETNVVGLYVSHTQTYMAFHRLHTMKPSKLASKWDKKANMSSKLSEKFKII